MKTRPSRGLEPLLAEALLAGAAGVLLMLRAAVVGTNPASTGAQYFFGLDAVVLDTP